MLETNKPTESEKEELKRIQSDINELEDKLSVLKKHRVELIINLESKSSDLMDRCKALKERNLVVEAVLLYRNERNVSTSIAKVVVDAIKVSHHVKH